MMDRQKNITVFECDGCHETFEGKEGEPFIAVWAQAADEGWQARKVGEAWEHKCPKCTGGKA